MARYVKRPAYDETLSSWLYRVSVTRSGSQYSKFTAALRALTKDVTHPISPLKYALGNEIGSETTLFANRDADIDYDMNLVKGVVGASLEQFGVNLQFFVPNSDLITPFSMRRYYCPDCLEEDVAAIGFPYWRKSWTYCMTGYCVQHNRLLAISRTSPSDYDRAWIAFKEDSAGAPSNPFRRMRDRLAIRIQCWYFRQPGFNTFGLVHSGRSVAMFDLTYSLLLKCRTRFDGGGYACALAREYRAQIVRQILPLSERIQTGLAQAVPVQRAYALILTGMILGLISTEHIARFVGLARQHGIPWPSTPFEIGKMAMQYASREEYFVLRELYSATPASLVDRCADFFRGLEHGAYSLRDEYSSRDREWLNSGSPHQRWMFRPQSEVER
ncbi:hypothetical protein EGJ27_02965 [Pseudomonas sp. v388]|uniref:TniQ family protein n=1 Tax=Pseudomonas sp. v388 TaxID=2479849 RepID=UPI000F7677AF|nr:TniQ family protein [Pseudomonas sp. v388]RRV10590.1 hypothetical protein EGJ27_02965 [Pseudomonas sp. v388]